MHGLEIVNPGMLSLLQDRGRMGVGHLGLSSGGPVDWHAYGWANKLLGNHGNAACIEITMGNAKFKAHQDLSLALTGADMQAKIDGVNIGNWRSFQLKKGQTLSFAFANGGLRSYLAVCGGFNINTFAGSVATVMRNQLGGLPQANQEFGLGDKLNTGDLLPVGCDQVSTHTACKVNHCVPARYQRHYKSPVVLQVIESYQSEQFEAQHKQTLYSNSYTISPQSDRMGVRLSGKPVECQIGGVISEGIALGAIQIPADGQPIILLNDRQTLGGYPKIGCLTRESISALAQAAPGSQVTFQKAQLRAATERWKQYCKFFAWN